MKLISFSPFSIFANARVAKLLTPPGSGIPFLRINPRVAFYISLSIAVIFLDGLSLVSKCFPK